MNFTRVSKALMAAVYLVFGIFVASLAKTGAIKPIGVCDGRVADNLPPAQDVVGLYTSNRIGKMRLYDPDQATLQALRGTNIGLIIGVPNGDIQSLATPATANVWVQNNIIAFTPAVEFRYIAVGNEIKSTDPEAQYVLPAMKNIYDALVSKQLGDRIKVSTAVEASLLGQSYPPSSGSFGATSGPYMTPIIEFLSTTGAPLLVNLYPYFAYISNPQDISLDYALFTSPGPVVQDGALSYQNLFDAILDAFYSALETSGGANVGIVVSETGWPSFGEASATVKNAETYYKNMINHVMNGTPKRPGQAIETYLFAMFDENQKGPAETERHFGLFSPDKQLKVGCFPLANLLTPQSKKDELGCSLVINRAVMAHNELLKKTLEDFRIKHGAEITISYADYYNSYKTIMGKPARFGVFDGSRACCGIGGGLINFNFHNLCSMAGTIVCGNLANHVQ